MNSIKFFLLLFTILLLTSCEEESHSFPIDKRYWDVEDYDNVIRELRFGYKGDEKLPTFDDPSSKIIVQKLTDQQNFNIVLLDKELGSKHKSEVSERFFKEWKEMVAIYNILNRKDEYVYDMELLEVWHFGLALQLQYFVLGNTQILKESDDPDAKSVQNTIRSNQKVLIKNYLIYLDEINREDAFSDRGKIKYAEGISTYFTKLVATYPEADYSLLTNKLSVLSKKVSSPKIMEAIEGLLQKITIEKKMD